ncbi:YcnI family protein [Haloechinothrix sp. YIM 98757]|uniref:YcnI family protein n=1 Tax=Haloechinothrix aidingensis TaxID=2752311 RepID=A0A838A776_9PSEU|nr:YcnI family protein [Haloechinothrix aidingensis]MBA0124109.1 YcnI family protein [Haloechinothrix aidingensis]
MSIKHATFRTAVLTAAVSITGLLATGTAAAHVTAHSYGDRPEQEGYGAITLRVPNEEADRGTTEVAVTIPEEYAITSARTKPVPGWSAEIRTDELAEPIDGPHGGEVDEVVTGIVWQAEPGNEIAAGTSEYQEFAFTVGTLPSDVEELVLPTAQTYEGGEVVEWDAPPPAEGADEPEYPAPVVPLAEQGASGHGHDDEPDTENGNAGGTDGALSEQGTDNTARWLGGAGFGLGALGLGVGIGATVRARRAGDASTGGAANEGSGAAR